MGWTALGGRCGSQAFDLPACIRRLGAAAFGLPFSIAGFCPQGPLGFGSAGCVARLWSGTLGLRAFGPRRRLRSRIAGLGLFSCAKLINHRSPGSGLGCSVWFS